MESLNLKKDFFPEKDKSYSVCLRGARRYSTGNADGVDLYIYAPNNAENSNGDKEPILGEIINQQHFRFTDLEQGDYCDNYDDKCKSHQPLWAAMKKIYLDFNKYEIVTILRFKIV